MKEKRNQWAADYENALKKKNVEKLQRIYREIYDAAEAGDSEALNLLGYVENAEKTNKVRVGRLVIKAAEAGSIVGARNVAKIFQQGTCASQDLGKARKYLDIAAKGKNRKAMLLRAWNLIGIEKDYEYDQDAKKAYQQLKEYITEYVPKEENDAESEIILQFFYLCGSSLGINMEQEVLPEAWKEFFDQRNPESEVVKQVKVHSFESAGKYFEAAKIYLELKTKYDIEQVCRLFRNEYFETNPKQRQFLDEALCRIRDDENTSEDTRVYLYGWYGKRYFEMENYVKAYACYSKEMWLDNSDKKGKDYFTILVGILKKYLSDSLGTVDEFYEKVLAEGCYEAAVQLAQIYRWQGKLEKAKQYALKGAKYAHNSGMKKMGEIIAEEIDRNMQRQKREREEAEEEVKVCLSKGEKNYEERLQLNEKFKGNTYVWLKTMPPFNADGVKELLLEVIGSLGASYVLAAYQDYTEVIPYILEMEQDKEIWEEVKRTLEESNHLSEFESIEMYIPYWRLVL